MGWHGIECAGFPDQTALLSSPISSSSSEATRCGAARSVGAVQRLAARQPAIVLAVREDCHRPAAARCLRAAAAAPGGLQVTAIVTKPSRRATRFGLRVRFSLPVCHFRSRKHGSYAFSAWKAQRSLICDARFVSICCQLACGFRTTNNDDEPPEHPLVDHLNYSESMIKLIQAWEAWHALIE